MLRSLGIVRDMFVGYILSGDLAFLCYLSLEKSPPQVFRKMNARRERKGNPSIKLGELWRSALKTLKKW